MKLTDRELATTLVALRHLAEFYGEDPDFQDSLEADWPDHFHDARPLTPEEIRDLCDRLNSAESSGIRSLREDEAEFDLSIVPEHVPVRDNALSCGDPALDRAAEDEILQRLDIFDTWAWCTVIVTARWRGFEGSDVLGCCSYRDAEDFKRAGGYYSDMKQRALDELNARLQRIGDLLEA